MNNKEIEEMAKIIALEMCPTQKEYSKFNNEATCYFARCRNIKNAVDKLINAGYRKIPEDSVVLSKGAYESLSSKAKANVVNAVEIRKATAKNFLNMIYWKAVKHMKGENKDECFIEMSFEKLDELAKEFGGEIKE